MSYKLKERDGIRKSTIKRWNKFLFERAFRYESKYWRWEWAWNSWMTSILETWNISLGQTILWVGKSTSQSKKTKCKTLGSNQPALRQNWRSRGHDQRRTWN